LTFLGILAVFPWIFQYSIQRASREIKATRYGATGIACHRVPDRQGGDNPKRLCVPIESVPQSGFSSKSIEFLFRDVPKRRMAEVVSKCSRFSRIGIDSANADSL